MKPEPSAIVLLFCALSGTVTALASDVEDVYVLRSLRLTRVEATPFCAPDRAGFENARFEDTYEFKSISVNPENGLVTDSSVQTVGTLHACFGNAAEPMVFNFYAEGKLGDTGFIGNGECRTVKPDFPEAGIRPSRCFMVLRGLPDGYVGGLLTTSSITSRSWVGDTSDPPGYLQPSIATVRLWKKPHRE